MQDPQSPKVVVVRWWECGGGKLLTSLHWESNLPVWAWEGLTVNIFILLCLRYLFLSAAS